LSNIALWILLCCAAFIWLVRLLRREQLSLGLPIAYLIALLLIHVPGAITPIMSDEFAYNAEVIEIGIRFAAIGAVCFVIGVQIARFLNRRKRPVQQDVERREFWYFCLIGGLSVQFGFSFLGEVPSVAAVVNRASALWMLGVVLGLRSAFGRGQVRGSAFWGASAMIYPVLTLLLAGFLSYGSTAVIVVLSPLVVSVKNRMRLIVGGVLAIFIGMTIFVNYFAHRDEFRQIVWSEASFTDRVNGAAEMFSNFHWFDPTDDTQLAALNTRLNQNYFVGLAAMRIEQGQVDYLYGRSIWEGVEALVPRIFWTDKPVFGGSGTIVADMTGLTLNKDTSWGVGNVMEFEINFGTAGVAIGFSILGFLLGWLDYKAAAADARGDIGKLILFFLVAVALIQPNGSIVELAGSSAAALVSAYVWKWLWGLLLQRMHRAASREFVPSP
jgi:hypothetical protein